MTLVRVNLTLRKEQVDFYKGRKGTLSERVRYLMDEDIDRIRKEEQESVASSVSKGVGKE